MILYRCADNRIFIINEYSILVPIAVLVDVAIILYILRKKYIKKGIKKKEAFPPILTRGGDDFIDVSYIDIDCQIEEGLSFLDDQKISKVIHALYSSKRIGNIIHITATAVCHLFRQTRNNIIVFPIIIGNFALTNLYQTIRKVLVTVLLGSVAPMYIIGGPAALIFAFGFATAGLRLAFSNLDYLPTTRIIESGLPIESRIPTVNEVVIIKNRDKMIMVNPTLPKKECWLADQTLFNPECRIKSTEIPQAIKLVSTELNLNYEDVVNMKDVTGLERVNFSDFLDLGKEVKPRKGKTVNFLDKFADSGPINELDTWDASEYSVPEKRPLRTRN